MKAIIYARVSSVSDRQNTERQVKDLMEYANYQKYEVVRVFEEKVSGAKKNSDRAILQEAIEYCISQKIDILLCSELSRIGRSSFEVLERVYNEKKNRYDYKKVSTLKIDKKHPIFDNDYVYGQEEEPVGKTYFKGSASKLAPGMLIRQTK